MLRPALQGNCRGSVQEPCHLSEWIDACRTANMYDKVDVKKKGCELSFAWKGHIMVKWIRQENEAALGVLEECVAKDHESGCNSILRSERYPSI